MQERQDGDTGVVAEVAKHVAAGRCILFLGAGLHYPPPEGSPYKYLSKERPPSGTALSEKLAKECGFRKKFPSESETDFQRVSLWYETRKTRSKLVKRISKEVDAGKKPSPVVRALAQLNFPLVITTNYDRLFERALYQAGMDPRPIVYTPDETTPTPDFDIEPDSPVLLKIHGSVEKPDSIVVTDEDYIQFVLRMSGKERFYPVPITFLYHLKKWPTLFIGYSLMDYNLRLLFKAMRWKIDPANIPDAYSVDKHPDPLILDVWWNQRRYVQFIAQDVWTFVPELFRRVTNKEMPA